MYNKIDLGRAIFFDIETVPEQADYAELDAHWQFYWRDKWQKTRAARYKHVFDAEPPLLAEADLAEEAAMAYREAGLYAEFGKIACVTLGRFVEYGPDAGSRHFQTTSIYGTDERAILETLEKVFVKYGGRQSPQIHKGKPLFGYDYCLVGHNVREFDVPYLCRRMLVHGICLPELIDCTGLKPWEVQHVVDTMQLWKFGDIKAYTSLALLCQRFGVPTPKDAMDGGGVYDAYQQGRHADIAHYCALDVRAVAELLLRWRNEPLLEAEEIELKMAQVGAPARLEVVQVG